MPPFVVTMEYVNVSPTATSVIVADLTTNTFGNVTGRVNVFEAVEPVTVRPSAEVNE
ncbi:hypothetical protein D3C75_1227470 [compost metagenome]